MVDCFNELLTQPNANPTPLRRAETAIFAGLLQLLLQYARGLDGATHRHLPKPRVETRVQTRVATWVTTWGVNQCACTTQGYVPHIQL